MKKNQYLNLNFIKLITFRNENPAIKIIKGVVLDLLTPVNISRFWNVGRCLGACLGLQLVSGLFLARHYNSSPFMAFDSVEHIIKDVRIGWHFRIVLLNGACF